MSDECGNKISFNPEEEQYLEKLNRLQKKVFIYEEALNIMASWSEGEEVGPHFDCPSHALRARSALELAK